MSDTTVEWDDDALTKLENVPVFVRKMVKGKIEKAAIAKGETKITAELMDIIKSEEMQLATAQDLKQFIYISLLHLTSPQGLHRNSGLEGFFIS